MHLHFRSNVGTTYKRSHKRFHLIRDGIVPRHSTIFTLIDRLSNGFPRNTIEDFSVRKPREYDTELRALDRAKELKMRKVQQLGGLVIKTGTDVPPLDMIAGMLLAAIETRDPATREAWAKRGAAFFQRVTADKVGARDKSLKP